MINSPEHIALAAEVAEKTPVLLKNNPAGDESTPILPLTLESINKIAVIGPQADKVELGPYSGMTAD